MALLTRIGKASSVRASIQEIEVRHAEDRENTYNLDPPIKVYRVTVETDDSLWCETFGSKIEAEAFERGLLASSSALGHMGQISVEWVSG